jgi:hypothetical protein
LSKRSDPIQTNFHILPNSILLIYEVGNGSNTSKTWVNKNAIPTPQMTKPAERNADIRGCLGRLMKCFPTIKAIVATPNWLLVKPSK